MYLKQTIRITFILFGFLSIFFLILNSHASGGNDYVFFKNFVRHSNGQLCTHTPPEAAFTVYLNQDQGKILIENAPRWDTAAEPNIPGNGTFGIELGNFANPPIAVGDSVFIRFTCNASGERGVLSALVTGIPWYYFPVSLYLSPTNIPQPPQNVTLTIDTLTFWRTVSWTQEPGLTYDVYRRSYSDTIADGRPRMLYHLIAGGIVGDHFTDSTATAAEKYGYILYAVNSNGVKSVHSEEVNEDPYVKPGLDITIKYIARLPRMDYVWGSPNPAVEGWPAPGSTVIWRAVVKNWADSTLVAVGYKWAIDSLVVDSGTVDIPALDTAFVDLPWVWTFNRHRIKFIIDPQNTVPEEEEENNRLMVFSDAISAGFYVEQSVYDYFHQYQKELGVHANCWEDWAHRHVERWNNMFRSAVYPDSPQGVLDRIRIDKITVVPDGALPLAGGLPTNNPNMNDRTVDLQWGFPATLLNGGMYDNHTSTSLNNPFYFEGSLLHELGHARYLIDLYGFNLNEDGSGNTVGILENGQLIAGTPYMPLTGGGVYFTPFRGLMNGQYTYISEYSTPALNLIAGHRATYGNYNAPGNIGVFLQDLPAQNRLTVKDENGNILPLADVKVYRAAPQGGVWYGKYFDNVPDMYLTADSNGVVLLGHCPFSSTGIIQHTYGFSNGVAILRVEHGGKIGYGFLEVTLFNMEYWRGHTSLGNYELNVALVNPTGIEGGVAKLLPNGMVLYQNYPNPFNPATHIRFSTSAAAEIELTIYNALGQVVRNLFSGKVAAGNQQAVWNGTDNAGRNVSSGVYYYRLSSSSGDVAVKKMLLLR